MSGRYGFDSDLQSAAVLKVTACDDCRCAIAARGLVLGESKKLPETTREALALASSLDGGLNDRLAFYARHSKRLLPKFAAAYDALIAHLAELDQGKIGPAVGSPMPDFLLPDQDGHLTSLHELLRSGPAVISMNRGHWCPYCKLDLRALAAAAPEIRRMGARVVSIMPETTQFTKKSAVDIEAPFPILTDVDLGYALSLGMVYWVGAELKALYDELGVALEKFQGNSGYLLPVAGKFVVGRDGGVVAREVNIDFRQRMEPKDILAALAKL
jgi:peroxiredoxin